MYVYIYMSERESVCVSVCVYREKERVCVVSLYHVGCNTHLY